MTNSSPNIPYTFCTLELDSELRITEGPLLPLLPSPWRTPLKDYRRGTGMFVGDRGPQGFNLSPSPCLCVLFQRKRTKGIHFSKLFSLWFLLKGVGGCGTPSKYPQGRDMGCLPSLTVGGDREMTPSWSLSFHACKVERGEVHIQEPF